LSRSFVKCVAMTTSIDSNIIVALWWEQDPLNRVAAKMLVQAQRRGKLVVSAPVYAELMGDPNRSETELDEFLGDAGILIDWVLGEEVWRGAGIAYRRYIQRRRSSSGTFPRRILTDFLIGAHSVVRGHTLLTFDKRLYEAAFPKLSIVSN
jgi:predicted nucleic acid-binding protein